MSIFRIGEIQSKPELVTEMREFLISIIPAIKASPGCESVQLYQSHDEPTKFTVIEVWDSIESHQASVQNISPDDRSKIRPMLASAPRGSYFKLINET